MYRLRRKRALNRQGGFHVRLKKAVYTITMMERPNFWLATLCSQSSQSVLRSRSGRRVRSNVGVLHGGATHHACGLHACAAERTVVRRGAAGRMVVPVIRLIGAGGKLVVIHIVVLISLHSGDTRYGQKELAGRGIVAVDNNEVEFTTTDWQARHRSTTTTWSVIFRHQKSEVAALVIDSVDL